MMITERYRETITRKFKIKEEHDRWLVDYDGGHDTQTLEVIEHELSIHFHIVVICPLFARILKDHDLKGTYAIMYDMVDDLNGSAICSGLYSSGQPTIEDCRNMIELVGLSHNGTHPYFTKKGVQE